MKEVVGKVFDEKDIERMKKEQERDARLIYQNSMRYAKEEGFKEGLEIGKRQFKVEVAKEMLKDNMPIKDIAEITKLSEKEILKLK